MDITNLLFQVHQFRTCIFALLAIGFRKGKIMTPQEALQILDNAASRAALSRADHVAVQQAVQVLAEAVLPKEEKVKAPALPEQQKKDG